MAAIRPRCSSATRPASTTSPARPIACRSRGSPPPRRRWVRRSRRNDAFRASARRQARPGGRARRGGLAGQTLAAMVVMRALFDRVLIETVGVGQSETDVAGVADTVMFCVQPGAGDALQFMKAGIVEIPHLIAVTKADLGAAAERARADVAGALSLAAADGAWPLRTLAVSARSGAGLEGLMAALEAHREHLSADARLALARHRQSEGWIAQSLGERFGRAGIARLGRLGFDLSLPPGAQPFERLRELAAILENAR